MYASEEPSKWSKYVEISTWVLLFIVLVPGTALGFFAEKSLPNSPLYPVKRGMESVVLALSSLTPATKSKYELQLATTRVDETQKLLADNTVTTQDVGQLSITAAQILETKQVIDTLTDPTQKTIMQQQLQETIATYRQQINQVQQQIQTTSQNIDTNQNNNGNMNQNKITNTQNQTTTNTQNTTTQTSNTTQNEVPSPIPTPALSDAEKAALEQQLQSINDQLNQIIATMPTPTPSPTPTDPPTPTLLPWKTSTHHNVPDNQSEEFHNQTN